MEQCIATEPSIPTDQQSSTVCATASLCAYECGVISVYVTVCVVIAICCYPVVIVVRVWVLLLWIVVACQVFVVVCPSCCHHVVAC